MTPSQLPLFFLWLARAGKRKEIILQRPTKPAGYLVVTLSPQAARRITLGLGDEGVFMGLQDHEARPWSDVAWSEAMLSNDQVIIVSRPFLVAGVNAGPGAEIRIPLMGQAAALARKVIERKPGRLSWREIAVRADGQVAGVGARAFNFLPLTCR